ncbi:MAG: hypothetical protein M0D55_17955 [Elusimicrobiota bacterium]|nr:MAG: hypothetical protein M0D55_17955 [Elusimicrobiota bacterium]
MTALVLAVLLAAPAAAAAGGDVRDPAFWPALDRLIAAHPGRSGLYSLEKERNPCSLAPG